MSRLVSLKANDAKVSINLRIRKCVLVGGLIISHKYSKLRYVQSEVNMTKWPKTLLDKN